MRVRFDDLLKPEYVGTRKGSSIDELTRAAVACGLNCETANGMTCGILRRLQSPTVLHVRGAFESSDYDHWILFMGIEDGKARIYDGSHAAELIDLGDLTARWDGTGLILSDSPIDCSVLYLESAAYFCFIAAPALFVVGTGRYVQRRWAARGIWRRPSWKTAMMSSFCEVTAIAAIAIFSVFTCRVFHSPGF